MDFSEQDENPRRNEPVNLDAVGTDRRKSRCDATKPESVLPGEFEPYGRAGLQLIPLHRWNSRNRGRELGKVPRDARWQARSYDNEALIAEAKTTGVNLGCCLPAHFVVLDNDPRNHPSGRDSFKALVDAFGLNLENCPHVITGSGGDHYYFRKPVDTRVVDSLKEYPGVEFKSIGRQVVCAGSVHPNGHRYEWDDFAPRLADAPEIPACLLDAIKRPTRGGSENTRFGELTPDRLAATLELLEVTDFNNQESWQRLMMACHHATAGDGRQEFIDWSTSDPDYQGDAQVIGRRWDSLHTARDGAITIGTLHKFLQERGLQIPPVPPEEDFEEVAEIDGATAAMGLSSEATALKELNRTHFTVLHGGKYLVGRERVHPTLGFLTVEWCSDEAVRKHLNARSVEVAQPGGGSKQERLGKFWTEHPGRRMYDGVVFDPSRQRRHEGLYNLWRGWAVNPVPGDWSLMKQLIKEVLCRGDEDCFSYVMRWCAFLVQHPDVPAEVVLVFRGRKGRGKGSFCRALVELAGQHGHHIANSQHFVGRFNEHLLGCIMLFVDEGFWAGDRKAEGVLKNLVTEKTLTIEPKGMPVVRGPNLLHIVMASNDDWVVPATEDERRFAVFDCCEDAFRALPSNFFEMLNLQMDCGGRAGMLHELLSIDIAGWHPRKGVPKTRALIDQKLESLRQDPVMSWWHSLLENGKILFVSEDGKWAEAPLSIDPEGKDRMVELLNGNLSRRPPISKTKLGQVLKRLGVEINVKDRRGRPAWVVPKLDDARRDFERWIGGPIDWD